MTAESTAAAGRRCITPARVMVALCTLPAVVVGFGFIFHTSLEPDVLGKYSWPFFALIIAWFVLVVPGVYLFLTFLFGTQYVNLSGGRRAPVRPFPKVLVAITVGSILYAIGGGKIMKIVFHSSTTQGDRFHPFLQNSPRPESELLYTNRWGFRGDDIEQVKPADEFRVFVLGGSTVFCGRVPYEESHPAVLQQKLQARHPDRIIRVQNAGADWHTSQHSLIKLLTNIVEFQPDVVIVYHGINDLCRSFEPDALTRGEYQFDYSHYYGSVAGMAHPAVRGQLMGMRFDCLFSDFRRDQARVVAPGPDGKPVEQVMFFAKSEPVEIQTWRSQPAFERNMREIARAAEAHDFTLILASQPFLYRADLTEKEREQLWFPKMNAVDGQRPSIESMAAGMMSFNETAEEVARSFGLTFVDLETVVPKTTEFFYDDVHCTPRGCEIIAEAFADVVRVE